MVETPPFEPNRLLATPIRDLGLTIAGTPLEPVLKHFQRELEQAGIVRLKPNFYLSTEWGVPFGTVSIAIPFYLARPDLTEVHAEKVGHLEGIGPAELLRYLRHEMGHVINYAYKLYEQEEWINIFGSITQPYSEAYKPKPFSRKFVRHLPGWYAQKHPDEDWAETFAVWMTPQSDWRASYAGWPNALAKLEYCDRTMKTLKEQDALVTATELDEDVSSLGNSLEDFYRGLTDLDGEALPPGLDGALQAIFQDYGDPALSSAAPLRPAAALLHRLERELAANVYRWSGHFPEATRKLVRHLAQRARELKQVYPAEQEAAVMVAVTTLVTTLAMNHVIRGSYIP